MTGVNRGAEGRLSAEPDGLRPSRRGSAHDDPLVRAGRTVRRGPARSVVGRAAARAAARHTPTPVRAAARMGQ